MNALIPFISSLFYRLTGCGKDGRFLPFMKPGCPISSPFWRRWGIGIVIALIQWNWIYAVTYAIATNCFAYGDNDWIRKRFGRIVCWAVYGFMFGAASLRLENAIFCAIIFVFLMTISNDHGLDHAYVELGFGFLGTAVNFV